LWRRPPDWRRSGDLAGSLASGEAVPEDPSPFGDDLFGQTHVRAYRETGGGRGYH